MSLEREGDWETPPFPEIRTIQPLTKNTVPYVDQMTRLYGDFIGGKLAKPSYSFAQYLQQNPAAPISGRGDFDFALSQLRNRPNVVGKTDTRAAYDTARAEGERDFKMRGLPSILESFGARGGRYGSDVARAGSNTLGDMYTRLATQAARDDIGASEAYAGRELQGSQQYSGQMATIAQILNMMAGLEDVNKRYAYADYLKDQPETYLQGARSFLDIQPIFPNVIVGPTGFYKEKPNFWDYLGRIQQHAQGDSAIFGNVAGGIAGSSRKLKENERDLEPIERTEIADAMLDAPVKQWNYKPELVVHEKDRIGPMLEDLPEVLRETNISLDMLSYMGALLITIQEQNKRIEALEAKLMPQHAEGV